MNPTTQEAANKQLFYSLKETAQMLGISYRAIQDWQYSHRIKTVKLGRRVMVPATELDRITVEGVK